MNLSKKTIKHILRILNDKCEECSVPGLPTRNYVVKTKGQIRLIRCFSTKEEGRFLS